GGALPPPPSAGKTICGFAPLEQAAPSNNPNDTAVSPLRIHAKFMNRSSETLNHPVRSFALEVTAHSRGQHDRRTHLPTRMSSTSCALQQRRFPIRASKFMGGGRGFGLS